MTSGLVALDRVIAHADVAADLAAFAVARGLDPEPIAVDQCQQRGRAAEHFRGQRDQRVEFALGFAVEQRQRVKRGHPPCFVGKDVWAGDRQGT